MHFLVTRDPTHVGAASVSYVKHKGDPDIVRDFVYVEGRNFSGTKVITSTLTVTAQGFVPATTPLQLYPTGLALSAIDDTVLVGGATARVGTVLQVLDPATLQSLPPSPYSSFPMLGPQAGPVTFSISNSTPAVGVLTPSSPAVFPVGASQVVSTFKALSFGTSTLRLAEPPGFAQPSDTLNAVVENVVPVDGFGIEAPPVGAHAVTPALLELAKPPTTPLTVTVTSSDPAHFLLATDLVNVSASASVTLSFLPGQGTKAYIYVYGGNFTGKTPITASLIVSAPGHSTVSTPLTLFPTGLAFLTAPFESCVGCFSIFLQIRQVLLHPDTLTFFTGASIHSGLTPESYAVSSSNPTVGTIIDSPAPLRGGYDYGTTGAPSFVPHADGTTVLTLIPPPGYAIPANLPTQIPVTVKTD